MHSPLLDDLSISEEDYLEDVLCLLYKWWKIMPFGWLLELFPMKMRVQRDEDDEWERETIVNLGWAWIILMQDQE